jgi:flagellar motor protein MotB
MFSSVLRWQKIGVGCLGLCAACVPASQYREAEARLRAEQSAHQKDRAERDALDQKVRQVQAELASARAMAQERDHAVEASQQRIAQSELDVSVVSKQREETAQLVDQLRNELARSSDHLRAFSDQKRSLEQSLAAAEARLKELGELQQRMMNRSLIARDLALNLYQTAALKVEFTLVDGQPVLRVPAVQLFAGHGNTLRPAAKPIIAAVARAVTLHPGTKVEITLRETPEPLRTTRIKRITDTLGASGVPAGQVVIGASPAPAKPAALPPSKQVVEFRVLS